MIPRVRPLIAIGYKYNAPNVISFIVTYNAGNTQAGLNCLSNFPDQFLNVSISAVANNLVLYKFFVPVN